MSNEILLVDDDVDFVKTSKEILSRNGIQADTAFTGEQALEKILNRDYELVFLDIKLPGQSGFDILKKIRQSNNNVRVILITGHSEFQNAIEALDLNVSEILLKPIAPEELLRCCRDPLQ